MAEKNHLGVSRWKTVFTPGIIVSNMVAKKEKEQAKCIHLLVLKVSHRGRVDATVYARNISHITAVMNDVDLPNMIPSFMQLPSTRFLAFFLKEAISSFGASVARLSFTIMTSLER